MGPLNREGMGTLVTHRQVTRWQSDEQARASFWRERVVVSAFLSFIIRSFLSSSCFHLRIQKDSGNKREMKKSRVKKDDLNR